MPHDNDHLQPDDTGQPLTPNDPEDDGVDVSLIHWLLALTPEQRLEVLQAQVRSLAELRNAITKQL